MSSVVCYVNLTFGLAYLILGSIEFHVVRTAGSEREPLVRDTLVRVSFMFLYMVGTMNLLIGSFSLVLTAFRACRERQLSCRLLSNLSMGMSILLLCFFIEFRHQLQDPYYTLFLIELVSFVSRIIMILSFLIRECRHPSYVTEAENTVV